MQREKSAKRDIFIREPFPIPTTTSERATEGMNEIPFVGPPPRRAVPPLNNESPQVSLPSIWFHSQNVGKPTLPLPSTSILAFIDLRSFATGKITLGIMIHEGYGLRNE